MTHEPIDYTGPDLDYTPDEPRHAVEGEVVEVEYRPEIPKRVRSVAYIVGLVVSALAILVSGGAAIWLNSTLSTQVVATVGVVTAATSFLVSALGVAYRPTGPRA